ncbi:MAG TPA: DegT/DnrJ/EryC1/StrS family aminotransferase [Cyclobacteriaceae bacterium]
MDQHIPLSYNPIDSISLEQVLSQYSDNNHNQLVTDFENKIASLTGSPYVVAVNSGTAALHLSLKALQIKKGDEVLTSTFTYVGSVNPILYEHAVPVFIDSEMITWNMKPELVEKSIVERSKKPQAILVVHSYGMPANMSALLDISKKYGVPILEDAAEAIGSTYKGKHLGTLGDIGILSFNNNKIVTTYGGGAVLTKDESVYNKIKYWASQSRENKPYYEHHEVGYSYRMGSINAATGLASLKDFGKRIESSRQKFDYYLTQLHSNGDFLFNPEPDEYYSNRWLSTVRIVKKGFDVEGLIAVLKKEGVETRPFWNPMHKQPAFDRFPAYLNGNSDELFHSGICLPSSFSLTELQQSRVVDLLRKFCRN